MINLSIFGEPIFGIIWRFFVLLDASIMFKLLKF